LAVLIEYEAKIAVIGFSVAWQIDERKRIEIKKNENLFISHLHFKPIN